MKIWEYCQIRVVCDDTGKPTLLLSLERLDKSLNWSSHDKRVAELKPNDDFLYIFWKLINELGEEGWELIYSTTSTHIENVSEVYYLKRSRRDF
jgi:hypothetical protein